MSNELLALGEPFPTLVLFNVFLDIHTPLGVTVQPHIAFTMHSLKGYTPR